MKLRKENEVFEGQEYFPLASLTDEVPVLSCGGLTKRFLVPGWRMGWITINDRGKVLEREANAELSYSILREVPGLSPVMPQGAMYMMVSPRGDRERELVQVLVAIDSACFPSLQNDLDFVEKMISEESVFCLPGKCFNYPNYMRVVLTVPEPQLREACNRIIAFCSRHHVSAHASAFTHANTHAHANGHVNGSVCEAEAFKNVEKARVVEVKSASE
ncbi:Tyrosine aminotransferase [Chionoecetes opilio]|uniref:Tyrosine aminotransferase n=1 Tax=Chionoecetes opilio TaxID=41210 RepID=A0A8J4YKC9_CHIOP|nr:Tyrosine aminotransferase [Chionoecetes opilio]